MENTVSFREVLDAVEQLSLEDQETLMEIVHRRIVERRRAELARDIQEAHQELKAGRVRPATPADLMAEILS
jgi:hypothetical protein